MTSEKPAELTCIICPNGCQITVKRVTETVYEITGATCKRGKEYAEQEYREPKRMLITTIQVVGGVLPVLPVRSSKEIPKHRLLEAVKHVSRMAVRAPIKMGNVLEENLLSMGVDLIASRDMREK